MTLGVALLLIFAFYLVDKHNLWHAAVKIALGITVLGVFVVAGLFWSMSKEEKAAKDATLGAPVDPFTALGAIPAPPPGFGPAVPIIKTTPVAKLKTGVTNCYNRFEQKDDLYVIVYADTRMHDSSLGSVGCGIKVSILGRANDVYEPEAPERLFQADLVHIKVGKDKVWILAENITEDTEE